MTKRPDIWQEEKGKSTVGPAYESIKSDFDRTLKKGPTMGKRRDERKSDTPGPGQYTNSNVINMVKTKGASVRIGQTKRPDNFTKTDLKS